MVSEQSPQERYVSSLCGLDQLCRQELCRHLVVFRHYAPSDDTLRRARGALVWETRFDGWMARRRKQRLRIDPHNAIDARLVLFLRLLRRLPLEEQAADVPRNI